jgi:hypothetical protein
VFVFYCLLLENDAILFLYLVKTFEILTKFIRTINIYDIKHVYYINLSYDESRDLLGIINIDIDTFV